MKLSAYLYLFNARLREFDLDGMVANFTAFFHETVVATIPSQDDTYERLKEWERQYGSDRFRVIMTEVQLSNNRFDGDLKTAALQACSKSTSEDPRCYVIMDGDERVPLSQRHLWRATAKKLVSQSVVDGVLVSVVDLWGDETHAKPEMGVKFRMHRDTVVKRGVLPEAERDNGLFDTSKSDSTEPLLANGQLARFTLPTPNMLYVLHYGHLDVARRAKLNREFWHEHWKNRSGEEPTMMLDEKEAESVVAVEHGLPLT